MDSKNSINLHICRLDTETMPWVVAFTGPGDGPLGSVSVLGIHMFRSHPDNACVRDCINQLTNEQRARLSVSADDPNLWRAPAPNLRFIPLALERELNRLILGEARR
jgi:hypothetical protein